MRPRYSDWVTSWSLIQKPRVRSTDRRTSLVPRPGSQAGLPMVKSPGGIQTNPAGRRLPDGSWVGIDWISVVASQPVTTVR